MFALPKLLPDPTQLSIQFRVGTEGMKIKIKVQHKISNQNRILQQSTAFTSLSSAYPCPGTLWVLRFSVLSQAL